MVGSRFLCIFTESLDHQVSSSKLDSVALGEHIHGFLRRDVLISSVSSKYLKNSATSIERLLTGVPLGLILHHWLFLLYINDLPSHCVNEPIVMYADDITIFS